MAKGTSAIGKFRGKAGAMVFRVVDGKQVMQEYNPNPKDAKTTPQCCQREGMRLISRMGSAMLATVQMGYSQNSYPFSQFVKRNLRNSIVSGNTPGAVMIAYPNVVLAEDTLKRNTSVQPGTVDWGETTHLEIQVPVDIFSDIPATDLKLCIAAYCPDLGLGIVSDSQTGTALRATLSCPRNWDGQEAHVWVFVRADVGTIDPDAVNTSSSRLPYLTSLAVYCGFGEIQ